MVPSPKWSLPSFISTWKKWICREIWYILKLPSAIRELDILFPKVSSIFVARGNRPVELLRSNSNCVILLECHAMFIHTLLWQIWVTFGFMLLCSQCLLMDVPCPPSAPGQTCYWIYTYTFNQDQQGCDWWTSRFTVHAFILQYIYF